MTTLLDYKKITRDEKVSAGTQGAVDFNPGAGVIRVEDEAGKYSDFTHYQYGTTIRTNNRIFEFFIGDEPTDIGTLSIRRNSAGANAYGAKLDVRDRADVGAIAINSAFLHAGIGELYLVIPGVAAPTLNISNYHADGNIAFKINETTPIKPLELKPNGAINTHSIITIENGVSTNGIGVPNGSMFYGTDGALYFKGGSGTVTQIAAP